MKPPYSAVTRMLSENSPAARLHSSGRAGEDLNFCRDPNVPDSNIESRMRTWLSLFHFPFVLIFKLAEIIQLVDESFKTSPYSAFARMWWQCAGEKQLNFCRDFNY